MHFKRLLVPVWHSEVIKRAGKTRRTGQDLKAAEDGQAFWKEP